MSTLGLPTEHQQKLHADNRCLTCEFPKEHCQCNLKMGGRINPFMACAWCGVTQHKETTLVHVRVCADSPFGCGHKVVAWEVLRPYSAELYVMHCTNCRASLRFPSWIHLYNPDQDLSIPYST